jgi:hypothetical protein
MKATSMTYAIPMFPPVDPTRRRFLSNVAGIAAGGTALALAIPSAPAAAAFDPIFDSIEAHRTARAALLAALAEQNRLDEIGDRSGHWVASAACHADTEAFDRLIATAPTTLAGLQAWAAYLDEIRHVEEWMFEDEPPALIATLVEALGNLAVSS